VKRSRRICSNEVKGIKNEVLVVCVFITELCVCVCAAAAIVGAYERERESQQQ